MEDPSLLDVRKNLSFCVCSLQRSETKASQIILFILGTGSKSDHLGCCSIGVCLGFSLVVFCLSQMCFIRNIWNWVKIFFKNINMFLTGTNHRSDLKIRQKQGEKMLDLVFYRKTWLVSEEERFMFIVVQRDLKGLRSSAVNCVAADKVCSLPKVQERLGDVIFLHAEGPPGAKPSREMTQTAKDSCRKSIKQMLISRRLPIFISCMERSQF